MINILKNYFILFLILVVLNIILISTIITHFRNIEKRGTLYYLILYLIFYKQKNSLSSYMIKSIRYFCYLAKLLSKRKKSRSQILLVIVSLPCIGIVLQGKNFLVAMT